ncbi:MAG: hypothetical protein HY306_02940 [Nitrosomonadales bacterium]|nr:hypothetical protein [Nitrosomonadales bacterium]
MAHPNTPQHDWHFFRAGGFDQVRIDSGADLLALGRLDQKLWVALSCPTHGIEFDARTLALIDEDHDGHIRAVEIIAAATWAGALLKDANTLTKGLDVLPLSAINDGTEEGRLVLVAARHVLQSVGKPDADTVSAEDTADTQKLVAGMRFNGDGIIPPQAVEDAELKAVVEDIMACCGSLPDRSGEQGISAEIAEQFFTQAQAYAAWWKRAEDDGKVWFLGADTLAALEAYRAVQAKAEDYFTRCRMAAYDARAAAPLSRSVEDYQLLASQDLGMTAASVAAFPLAVIGADKPLPLQSGINPAWAAAVQALYDKVIAPLYGTQDALTAQEWDALAAKFSAVDEWLAGKPTSTGTGQVGIETLGIARIRAILSDGYPAEITNLIAQDKAVEAEVAAIASVDRLVHYCRDLHLLVNNFVSFRNFYTRAGRAVFQAGTLYLDGRSCELCVRVDDVAKHAVLANLSRVCLVYCECTRNKGAEKMFVAAAFTAGDSDQLIVGRNGVFYDRKGQDWDATIVRMLEHPISIRQAFWAPYKRVSKMIGEQVQKLAAAKSQSMEEKIVKTALESGQKADAPKPPPPPPFDVAKFAGIFAAIGLAVGALGTAVASMLTGLMGLRWWQLPFALVGLLLLVSGPAMLIAWFKLKQRNLGPILDANGWAVNARARINIPFGTSLTGIAKLPEGADRRLVDPFAEKKRVWPYYLILVLVACVAGWAMWLMGLFGK